MFIWQVQYNFIFNNIFQLQTYEPLFNDIPLRVAVTSLPSQYLYSIHKPGHNHDKLITKSLCNPYIIIALPDFNDIAIKTMIIHLNDINSNVAIYLYGKNNTIT